MALMNPEQIERLARELNGGQPMTDDEDAKALFQTGLRLGKAHKALEEIRTWCEAYPTPMFTPLTDEQISTARNALGVAGIDMGALHAGWACHLLDGISKIAREALDD